MTQWKYKSLEWIHNVREDDYNATKELTPKELIEKTRRAAEIIAKTLGLKTIYSKDKTFHHAG